MTQPNREPKSAESAQAMTNEIVWPLHILFDGPPSHESGRFVEVNDDTGKSVRAGEWIEKDGFWELVIQARPETEHVEPEGEDWIAAFNRIGGHVVLDESQKKGFRLGYQERCAETRPEGEVDALVAEADPLRPIISPPREASPGKMEWEEIVSLFERNGLPPPPWRLRDVLVGHLVWARYGDRLASALSSRRATGMVCDVCGLWCSDSKADAILSRVEGK